MTLQMLANRCDPEVKRAGKGTEVTERAGGATRPSAPRS